MSHEIFKKTTPYVYREFRQHDTKRQEQGRLDTECEHKFWVKRCSFCKGIMESDTQKNYEEGPAIKNLYTEFDSLVCNYDLSLALQQLKVIQKSKLYWVFREESEILSLRSHCNVCVNGNIVAAAFTSSELCRLLKKLPKDIITPQIYEYMGKHAHEPNRLARLYIKLKKHHAKTKRRLRH